MKISCTANKNVYKSVINKLYIVQKAQFLKIEDDLDVFNLPETFQLRPWMHCRHSSFANVHFGEMNTAFGTIEETEPL